MKDIDYYNECMKDIKTAYEDLAKQSKLIYSQAEVERKKLDLYLATEKENLQLKYDKKVSDLSEKTKKLDESLQSKKNEYNIKFADLAKRAELEQKRVNAYLKDKEENLQLEYNSKLSEQIKAEEMRIDLYLSEKEKTLKAEFNAKRRELSEKYNSLKAKYDTKNEELSAKEKHLELFEEALLKIAEERQIGCPWLSEKIAAATEIICENYYQRKSAYKYKDALAEINTLNGIIAFYEFIYPHLVELRIKRDATDAVENFEYTEEERTDESHFWLTTEEFRTKPAFERNQIALDRYRKKHLSNWEIGKLYERYVGYKKEIEGYKVDYHGILYNLEDRGRDLICTKKDEVLIIQCKNWSKSKTIYEKHIFQFYGTLFHARIKEKEMHPLAPRNIRGQFYTTTKLGDFAKQACVELGIELIEIDEIERDYPCIKCNINKDGEKIYHLPFDQQYDNTIIEPHKGEFYAMTCKEAEEKGYRRAFRYHQLRCYLS